MQAVKKKPLRQNSDVIDIKCMSFCFITSAIRKGERKGSGAQIEHKNTVGWMYWYLKSNWKSYSYIIIGITHMGLKYLKAMMS